MLCNPVSFSYLLKYVRLADYYDKLCTILFALSLKLNFLKFSWSGNLILIMVDLLDCMLNEELNTQDGL